MFFIYVQYRYIVRYTVQYTSLLLCYIGMHILRYLKCHTDRNLQKTTMIMDIPLTQNICTYLFIYLELLQVDKCHNGQYRLVNSFVIIGFFVEVVLEGGSPFPKYNLIYKVIYYMQDYGLYTRCSATRRPQSVCFCGHYESKSLYERMS